MFQEQQEYSFWESTNEEKVGRRNAASCCSERNLGNFSPCCVTLFEANPLSRIVFVCVFLEYPWRCCGTLTAEVRGFIAVVQTIIVSIALPALLDAAVVLAGEFTRLALWWGHVGGVG